MEDRYNILAGDPLGNNVDVIISKSDDSRLNRITNTVSVLKGKNVKSAKK